MKADTNKELVIFNIDDHPETRGTKRSIVFAEFQTILRLEQQNDEWTTTVGSDYLSVRA